MAILRARKDIEKDTEILTRYWHKEKDAWQSIFDSQCCACTNHMGMTITTPAETAEINTTEDLVPTVDYTPRGMQDLAIAPIFRHESSQDRSARDAQDYPESEMADWDWDELEESPYKETTTITNQQEKTPLTTQKNHDEEGGNAEDNYFDREVDNLDWDALERSPDRDSTTECESTSPLPTSLTCEQRQTHWLLCPAKCGCKNSLPSLVGKSRVIKDYGLRNGNAEPISNTYIAKGEIAAVFRETSTIWAQDDVREFDRIATQQNTINAQQFDIYASGNTPENQCHLRIIPCEDAELALIMGINPSLRHSLQSRAIWKGGGQYAKHTCCEQHQNVELQFITVQAREEDDDSNGLTLGKADVAAVLRAKREIQPEESIRYQYADRSVQGGNVFECECCLYFRLCLPQGQKTMLERLAVVPTQSFPETWTPRSKHR